MQGQTPMFPSIFGHEANERSMLILGVRVCSAASERSTLLLAWEWLDNNGIP